MRFQWVHVVSFVSTLAALVLEVLEGHIGTAILLGGGVLGVPFVCGAWDKYVQIRAARKILAVAGAELGLQLERCRQTRCCRRDCWQPAVLRIDGLELCEPHAQARLAAAEITRSSPP